MSIVNVISCTTSSGNTGTPSCYIDMKKITDVIIAPVGFKFTAANLATEAAFKAAVQAATLAGKSARIYPISNIIEMTDSSEETQYETAGYGDKRFIREGDYSFKFGFWKGGLCLNKQLRTFNSGSWTVYLVDAENTVYGHLVEGELFGFTTEFHAEKPKVADGAVSSKYMFEVNLPTPEELADDFGSVKLSFNFASQIKGILNATVTVLASTETYVDVKLTTDCGGVDLYDFYSTELADVTAFVIKNSGGTAVTPSLVAAQPTTKSWRVTATLTAGTYTAEGNTPAILAALGVGASPANGIETPTATSFTTTS